MVDYPFFSTTPNATGKLNGTASGDTWSSSTQTIGTNNTYILYFCAPRIDHGTGVPQTGGSDSVADNFNYTVAGTNESNTFTYNGTTYYACKVTLYTYGNVVSGKWFKISGTNYWGGTNYHAQFNFNISSYTYSLIYNGNATGASNIPSTQQTTSTSASSAFTVSSTVPTNSSGIFQSWNTNSAGTGTAYSAGNSITLSASSGMNNTTVTQTLYAQWVAAYTVTFNPNGGSFSYTNTTVNGITYGSTATSNATKQVSNGSTYGTLPSPTRTNYTFMGWFTSSTGGTEVISTTQVSLSSGQPLYAQWRGHYVYLIVPSEYTGVSATISYGGATKTVNSGGNWSYEVSPGSSVTFTASNPSNFVFRYWRIEPGGQPEYIALGTGTNHSYTLSDISDDYFVYPQYAQMCTVGFVSNNADYGTVSKSSITKVPEGTLFTVNGNQITINKDTPETVTATPKADTAQYRYRFINWSNVPISNQITRDITITALFSRYIQEYTVSFNPNGGTFSYTNTTVSGITYGSTTTSNATKTVAYGSTYGTLPTPSKANHTFTGWYTATTGGTKVTSNTTVALSDGQPLYARFTLNTYTVKFVPNDSAYGKVNNLLQVEVPNVPHGTTFTTTENVFTLNTSPVTTVTATSNEGYAFDYWGTNIGDQIVSNVTIEAIFVETHIMGSAAVPLEGVSTTLDTIYNGHYTDIYVFNGSSVSIGSSGDGESYSIDIYDVPSGYGLSNNYGSLGGTLTAIGDITVTYTYTEVDENDVYLTFTIHSIQGYTAELTVPSLPNAQATLSAPGYTSKTVTAGSTQSLQVVSGTSVTYELVTTPTDYQFRGWGLSATATSYENTLATYSKVITQNAHLYAIFGSTSTLTVTLDVSPSGAGTIGRMIGQASQIVTVPVPYSLADVPYNSEITVTSGNILTIGNDFATFVASETGFQGWSVASGTRITANMAIYAYYSSSGYTQTLTLYLGRTYTNQTFTGANGARMKNADTYTVSNVTFTNR